MIKNWNSKEFKIGVLGAGQLGRMLIQEAVNMEVGIKDGTLHPFTGPIYNQAGELVVPDGEVAPDGMLLGMNFYVKGIDGEVPQ